MALTVINSIETRAEAIRELLERLAFDHGDLRWRNPSQGGMFIMGPDHFWPDLEPEGRQLQSRIRGSFGELMELVNALLLDLPKAKAKKVEGAAKTVTDVIERQRTFSKTTAEAFQDSSGALDVILAAIADLYDGSSGSPIYVPDTNALIFNPNLDHWTFGKEQFTLLLTPLVLSELDELKVRSRPELALKSESIITRIKGYRDRGGGDLGSGVTLRKGVSTLRSIATEPRMMKSLPWLDPSNGDDRHIAVVVEIMRQHVRSPVTLVTRDINMQNKAAHAAIPYVEPPQPPKSNRP